MKRIVFILLCVVGPVFIANGQPQAGALLNSAIYEEEVNGDLEKAIESYKLIIGEYPKDRDITAEALLHLGMCYEKLGLDEARATYRTLIDNYPDQTEKVTLASKRLALIEQVYATLDQGPTFRKIRIASNPQNGVLSPDGKMLAFMSEDVVWTVPLQGKAGPDIAGEPIPVFKKQGLWDASGMLSWSADGKWIAVYGTFPDSEQGSLVYIIPVAGGDPRMISLPEQGGHSWSYRISLSPDGEELAFSAIDPDISSSDVVDVHNRRILTIPTDGGPPVKITSNWSRMPSFSPDGKYIACVGYRPREVLPENSHLSRVYGDLQIIDAMNGDLMTQVPVDGRLRGPVWSPDGAHIAAHLEPGGNNDSKEVLVFLLSEDVSSAKEVERITLPRSSWNMLAGWTPDDELGVFINNEEHTALYTVPVEGGKATQISPEGGWPYYPRWSKNGKRIYYRGYNEKDDKVHTQYIPYEGGTCITVPHETERWLVSIIPGGGFNISPDGKYLLMSAYQEPYNPEEGADLWILPLEEGNPRRLTNDDTYESYPCWSPDGQMIAFTNSETDSEGNEYTAIFTIPAEGGTVRKISEEKDSVSGGAIAFSPDQRTIAYFTKDAIRIIPVEGGRSGVLLTDINPHRHSQLAYSPDGNRIAYNSERKIWIASLHGGEPQELQTGLSTDAWYGEFSWSPDGKKIVFFRTSGGEAEFWLISNFLPPEP